MTQRHFKPCLVGTCWLSRRGATLHSAHTMSVKSEMSNCQNFGKTGKCATQLVLRWHDDMWTEGRNPDNLSDVGDYSRACLTQSNNGLIQSFASTC